MRRDIRHLLVVEALGNAAISSLTRAPFLKSPLRDWSRPVEEKCGL
jgi:hypothetical protein